MRKILSLAVLFALLIPSAQAATMRTTMISAMSRVAEAFNDFPSTHPNYPAVMFLAEQEVVKGYPDGSFQPNASVNRAELVKMVVGMMEGDVTQSGGANCFPDVRSEWFAPYVCYAKERGWIGGYPDGTFRPSNSVSRVEAMKIVLNVMIEESLWPAPTEAEKSLQMPKDGDMRQWYGMYLAFAVAKELLDGAHVTLVADGSYTYQPGAPMSRKEVAEMIFRTYLYMVERVEIAELLGETMCFQIAHASEDEETARNKWINQFLASRDYTEAEVDRLNTTYSEDEIVDALAQDVRENSCGDPTKVDMSRWEDLKRFGM